MANSSRGHFIGCNVIYNLLVKICRKLLGTLIKNVTIHL
jgi:hypothetical protein